MKEREAQSPSTTVTDLLQAWSSGDTRVEDQLMDLVYKELKRLAGSLMRSERKDHTVQPTALVHEAYLRLVDQRRVRWESRAQFFAIAARMMRRILVNHAIHRGRAKRGGGWTRISIEGFELPTAEKSLDVLRIDQALGRLQQEDPDKAKVVELRYFGGLSIDESAAALDCSPATVSRHWRMAKAWLFRELQEGGDDALEPLAKA